MSSLRPPPGASFTIMITRLKHLLIALGIGSVLTLGSTGCNTAHGFGKDLEKAGDKIQEGTK